MASIVVCGGGVVGLSAAAMLADDGHAVTVLEADHTTQTPARAWESWRRPGVAQFRQPHNLFARFRHVADAELPGLNAALLDAGCMWVDLIDKRPPSVANLTRRPTDDAFRFIAGRRPVVEAVVAEYAEARPGLTVRRGTRVHSLLVGRSVRARVPHVTGVRTETGERIPADLVIDATGRRSPAERWLTAVGADAPATEAADRGYVYYSRFYQGPKPPERLAPGLTPVGSFSILTLYGDNNTWSVTVYGLSNDAELKAVRDPVVFDRVIGACSRHAHWLDGTPLTGVQAMAGILDRHRRFVVSGRPVVSGFVAIGDAWACSNPSAGRGLCTGIVHAQVLREVTRAHLDDPLALVTAMDEQTAQRVAPFVHTQSAEDVRRVAEMAALRDGRPRPGAPTDLDRLLLAGRTDPEAYRAVIEILTCLAFEPDVLARPSVKQLIEDVTDVPPSSYGPDRAELVALLAA